LVRKDAVCEATYRVQAMAWDITLEFQALGVKARLDNSRMRLKSRYISLLREWMNLLRPGTFESFLAYCASDWLLGMRRLSADTMKSCSHIALIVYVGDKVKFPFTAFITFTAAKFELAF
jgi:hypothetical protein